MSTKFEDKDIIGFLEIIQDYKLFTEHIVVPANDISKDEVLPEPSEKMVQLVFSCIQRQLLPPIGIPRPNLEDVAVGILYNLIKNHYLNNGNKRIASFLFYCFFINTKLNQKYSSEELKNNNLLLNTVVEIAKFNSSNIEEINEFLTKVKTRLFVIK